MTKKIACMAGTSKYWQNVVRVNCIVWKILSHQKIFRQINSLVIHLVKPLLSQNFCHKYVRENSRNFHTVLSWFLREKYVKTYRTNHLIVFYELLFTLMSDESTITCKYSGQFMIFLKVDFTKVVKCGIHAVVGQCRKTRIRHFHSVKKFSC